MPEQGEVGLGTLFLEAMFKKYSEFATSIKTSAIPKLKKAVTVLLFIFAGLFFGSFSLVVLGTSTESNTITVLGRIGIILSMFILLMIATPIGYIFAGQKYITFVRSFAIYQMFSTLVIWVSPLPVTLPILFGLSLASCVLALVNALGSEMLTFRIITTAVFCFLLSAVYFPTLRDKLNFGIVEMNEPVLLKISHGEVPGGKIRFFLRGKPAVWYFVDTRGKYELFDHEGYHDIFQTRLKPITREIADLLMNEENLISSRNFVYSTAYTGTPTTSNEPTNIVAIPAETPTPPSAPYAQAPELTPAPSSPANTFQQPDNRKEYAIIAVDENYHPNRNLGEAMVDWIGVNRALYAYDHATNIIAGENGIDYSSRAELSKVAKKIIYAAYRTKFDREEGNLKYFSAYVLFKVIDAENGNVLRSPDKHIPNIKGPSGVEEERKTKNLALDFAVEAIKNECKKYM